MSYQLPINRPPKRRFVIGIDPDKNQSGFAVWDRQLNKWLRHEALYFAALQEACFDFKEKDTCEFFIEAGWENKGQNKYQSASEPDGFALWSRERREAYKFERGIDVGINFGAGYAITHVLRANGYLVHHYCPKIAKWDAQMLKLYTGITARTNQDVRDAIRAAFMNR